MKQFLFFLSLCACICTALSAHPRHEPHIILFVWDGLRPDSVSAETTPNLYHLMQEGTQCTDNHSSYPTFTMMNAASFATGDRAGKTGFYGNTLWHPGIQGTDAAGNPIDFNQPVFTEDYQILQDLNKDHLLFANTLFHAVHRKHLSTATFGKSGAAFIQDYLAEDFTLDEKHVAPLNFAKQLQTDDYPLPKLSPFDFLPGELVLAPNNGSPTEPEKIKMLADGVTSDPSDQQGSPYNRANEYMAHVYLNEILSKQMPALTVLWLRNPDTTEHNYGPGSLNYKDALQNNDKILGLLFTELKNHHLEDATDIIVVSDHAHSTVSGPLNIFPLRLIKNNQVSEISSNGYSVSGEVRSADLLTQAGFHAYDGGGCAYNPILSGIKHDGTSLYPVQTDMDGSLCGKANTKYITLSYKVPQNLPQDAVIVSANGGSDYFYVPSHDKKLVQKIVAFLASHTQYDALFTDSTRYGNIKGTISLATIGIQNKQGRSPDIIAGFSYDETAIINGMPGIEFSDGANIRGMHGSFSPIDVHNFLMAYGPDFRSHFKNTLPTGNVDVAPTIAFILGISLPNTDGRILFEALKNAEQKSYSVENKIIQAEQPLQHLKIVNALNQPTSTTQFSTKVYAKILKESEKKYYYFDQAKGVRN